jgi:hypothetical protein
MEQEKKPRGVHTALVLQPDVLEKLKKGSGGVSAEIRRRIDRTFLEDEFSEATRSLADAVMWIADEIDRQIGLPWNASRNGHLAVATALQTWLELCAPAAISGKDPLLFGPDDPETLGRSVARQYQRFNSDLAKIRALFPNESEVATLTKSLRKLMGKEEEE